MIHAIRITHPGVPNPCPSQFYLSFVARNGRLDHQLFRMNIVQSLCYNRALGKCRIRLTPEDQPL